MTWQVKQVMAGFVDMMQEVQTAIWKAQGQQPGKVITIIGGTHGNERTGVEVVQKLKTLIDAGKEQITSGTLILIHGNPRAIEINERGSVPYADLNRSYPIDLLAREPLGTYEDDRAREIAPFLEQSDVVVDLHATNKPSEPFIACVHSSHHEEVYRWFPTEKVLSDPNYVLAGNPVTTDEYAEAHGGIGVCYETGQASDVSRVDEVLVQILEFLADQELIDGEVPCPNVSEREIFEMTEPIILTKDGFEFDNGFGVSSWEEFSVGDVIGHHGATPFVSMYDGVIVFPKIPKLRQEGKPVAYLARRVR